MQPCLVDSDGKHGAEEHDHSDRHSERHDKVGGGDAIVWGVQREVLDFDDGQPVDPDPSEAKYGAGVATLDIQQLSSASKTVGIRYRVLVPYNGVPSLIAGGS